MQIGHIPESAEGSTKLSNEMKHTYITILKDQFD
jgi:hypothetical protein